MVVAAAEEDQSHPVAVVPLDVADVMPPENEAAAAGHALKPTKTAWGTSAEQQDGTAADSSAGEGAAFKSSEHYTGARKLSSAGSTASSASTSSSMQQSHIVFGSYANNIYESTNQRMQRVGNAQQGTAQHREARASEAASGMKKSAPHAQADAGDNKAATSPRRQGGGGEAGSGVVGPFQYRKNGDGCRPKTRIGIYDQRAVRANGSSDGIVYQGVEGDSVTVLNRYERDGRGLVAQSGGGLRGSGASRPGRLSPRGGGFGGGGTAAKPKPTPLHQAGRGKSSAGGFRGSSAKRASSGSPALAHKHGHQYGSPPQKATSGSTRYNILTGQNCNPANNAGGLAVGGTSNLPGYMKPKQIMPTLPRWR